MGDQATQATTATTAPADVVRAMFRHLEAGDVEAAAGVFAPDIVFINVSLPALHGRSTVRRVLATALGRSWVRLEVDFRSIAAAGDTVLTERTDVFVLGPVRIQMWVWGRFDVAGGQITLWKEYFDWWAGGVATVRGLIGAATRRK